MAASANDRNNIIKNGGSAVHSTATYPINANSARKDDTTGNGREYLRNTLESCVKNDQKQ